MVPAVNSADTQIDGKLAEFDARKTLSPAIDFLYRKRYIVLNRVQSYRRYENRLIFGNLVLEQKRRTSRKASTPPRQEETDNKAMSDQLTFVLRC